MANNVHIEERTKEFVLLYNKAKEMGLFKTDKELAVALDITTAQTLTEIKKFRQNIPAHILVRFKKLYNTENTEIVIPDKSLITKTSGKSVRKKHDSKELIPFYDVDFVAGSSIEFIEEAMTALDLQDVKLIDLKKSTIKVILDAYMLIREASEKQFNKNLGYLKSMIATACEYAEIEVSPAFKIKPFVVCDGEGFTPPTDEEQDVIREHLSQYHPNFFVLNLVIYHTGIRTNEALALRISDIDFQKHRFEIIPESNRNNAKTKKNRLVPIVDELWGYIEQMDLLKYPSNYYLFGSPGTPGRGWMGVIDKSMYYTPNPTRVKRDTATRLWKTIVKDGLGFDCDMYALKHKGAQDKEDAGMSDDAIQGLFGHSSKRMTRKYKGLIPHEKEIREKSPKF